MPGQLDIATLSAEFRRVARRSKTLRDDVGDALEDDAALALLLEQNPIAAWCGGKGTGGKAYFQYSEKVFSSDMTIPSECREEFQMMVRELTDWRLAEYLDRGSAVSVAGRLVCKVIHTQGRPILKLPDRRRTAGVPEGWVDVMANDQPYVANLVKEFVNVIRTNRESQDNILAEILRGWFGPDVGRPGTRYEVVFEIAGDELRMTPVNAERRP